MSQPTWGPDYRPRSGSGSACCWPEASSLQAGCSSWWVPSADTEGAGDHDPWSPASGVVPTMGNLTLVVAAMSYAGQLNLTAAAYRDSCADVEVFAQGVRDTLE